MINFMLNHYVAALGLVRQEVDVAAQRVQEQGGTATLNDDDKKRITQNMQYIAKKAEELGLETVHNRLARISSKFRLNPTILAGDMAVEMNVLLESFHDDVQFLYLYAYPREKVKQLIQFQATWAAALKAFPSIKKDAEAAGDLYGLGHDTACVFHLMRVAEIGLRALSRERKVSFPNKPVEWAQWQNLLDGIERSVKGQWGSASAGPAKDAALSFYSGALGQFHAFKDQYRNAVMHVRAAYDSLQALSAMNHVRDFMNGLSAKLDETTRKKIRRWP